MQQAFRSRRRFLGLAAAALVAIGTATPLAAPAAEPADAFPARPIRFVVPFPSGSGTDTTARMFAKKIGELTGQGVVVVNKPGGNGFIGVQTALNAPADGYTVFIGSNSTLSTNAATFRKLPYDPLTDFAPITGLGISPQALIVNPAVPAKSFSELVALGKKEPGKLNYGTFGVGTSGHLNIVLIESLTGAKFTPVHYRGAAPGLNDTIAGHIQMMIVSIGLIAQSWQAGGLKVLGFGSTTRLAQYPEVPTLAESGLPGYEAGSWYGLAAPKGTPLEIVA